MAVASRVLFVCLGNICRSPTAEAVFRDQAQKAGWGSLIAADSAGIADYHIGKSPDPRTCRAAAQRGYRMDDLRARQVQADDFHQFDLLLAMDASVLDVLRRMQPPESRERSEVALFLDYLPGFEGRDVPDPYYGGADGFETVLDLVEAGSTTLLREMLKRQGVFGCGC
ncbi:MAG TPA: low molecular weight protein-tyrosine-phosphatase [Moraxellaceae bacterium]|nr:low molecular weight protein-tyrosine-phosphatase [Moraxellaceae bacterium]